ncbi:FkbM family methyltransferase [uncultured Thiodictyon sp.]|uniref:FkbM family methyltransferase n=1 Tax=uncultured Thiodictyon sp. TaxID=1846217 RepID=UPI0025FC79E4|nr:FkbM family methyltransferase [uncultured Thiodictyon sp.]
MIFDFPDIGSPTDSLLDEARRDGITLFSAGHFARAVFAALQLRGIQVHAFVVSNRKGDGITGAPVISLADLTDSLCALPMWLAVFNRDSLSDLGTLMALCKARGIDRPRLPQDYFGLIAEQLGWRFWLTDRRHYAEQRSAIERAFQMLGDDTSRRYFIDTLRFRLATSANAPPRPSPSPQYFPADVLSELLSSGRGLTFVDGGACDGDTLMAAARHFTVAHAYAFEPDPENYSRLARTLGRCDFPVTCFPCGLSNANEWLSFASAQGEACAIMPNGEARIQCVRLDECLFNQPIDYIKLDVEGHELAALQGAQHIIERDRPVLAIAAYHRWDDIWKIPEFLQRVAPHYRLAYRTHESNTFDSVFYAVS